MCFVFILTENKWYIFFKKEIKCHTEKVCGIVKGAKKRTDSLINQTSNESSDLKIAIITSSAPNLCSDHASSNCIFGWLNWAILNDLERNPV